MRIVSLLPSATEIICGIGLRDQLVGITHECDYPPDVKGLPIVTRSRIPKGLASHQIDALVREQLTEDDALYSLDEEVIEALAPDLIVTQALCDVCAVSADEVERFACRLGNAQVINLEPVSLTDVLTTMTSVGAATGQAETANNYVCGLRQRIDRVVQRSTTIPAEHRPSVAILEWLDPLFDGGHWYPELIEMAGGIPCFGDRNQPAKQREWSELFSAQPDIMLVSLCGFDLQRTAKDIPLLTQQRGFINWKVSPSHRAYMVDGNCYFSRPGPRLVDSLELLAHTLHPQIHPLPVGLSAAVQLG